MRADIFRWLVNCYPPFLLSGIHVSRISADYRALDVRLSLRWYNRNYVGTQFGGSLFAMTDPWYMLMLAQLLGRDYLVWDRRASIDFIAPGRGMVTAQFRLDDAMLQSIYANTANGEKYLPEFHVDIVDSSGAVIAHVDKTVYVRKKKSGDR